MHAFRRGVQTAVLISFAGLLAGCLVTSLRPLSDETYPPIFDNSLLGRWIEVRENGESQDKGNVHILIEPWQKETGPAYKITHTVIDNQAITTTVLRGSLVELGSLRILDTVIGDDSMIKAVDSRVAEAHLRHVHFFSKVTVTDNTLVLLPLRNEWFMVKVLEEGISLPCIFECKDGAVEYCHVLLTGNPRQLREFFRIYGDQPNLFNEPGSSGVILRSVWRRS